jgi:hypothetical protein
VNGRDDRDDGYPGGTYSGSGAPRPADASEGGEGFAAYELAGYDEYGRPVYQQAAPAPFPSRQDPTDAYGTPQHPHAYEQQSFAPQQGYGYGVPQEHPAHYPQEYPAPGHAGAYAQPYPGAVPDPGGHGYPDPQGHGYGAHPSDHGTTPAAGYGTGVPYDAYPPHEPVPAQGPGPFHDGAAAGLTAHVPAQAPPPGPEHLGAEPAGAGPADPPRAPGTEQFSFVEEPDGDPEDVIDWLAFTENRTERREEAKRRARGRLVALGVVLALVAVGVLGYLGFAGKLPGLSGDEGPAGPAATGPQQRDVVLVHLHHTKQGGTSTALLVDNTTTERGSTILLPNTLGVATEDGTSTTLAKSVDDDGSTGTRTAVDTLLGTRIEGTWRLDTPYLNNLVELVGNIEVDTDVDVPAEKAAKGQAPLVRRGERQTLSGPMAVAYATHRAPGEAQDAQLARFGQVVQAVLRKLSSDAEAATVTVQSLAQILDPSLTEQDLGAFLARLSDRAKGGDYTTALLPVASGGALADEATETVVKPLLGGTVKAPAEGDAIRVGVRDASGADGDESVESARVVLVNGGYTVVDGGKHGAAPTTRVVHADAEHRQEAGEVAKTLGLPASAVVQGTVEGNAQIEVTLGRDYAPKSP